MSGLRGAMKLSVLALFLVGLAAGVLIHKQVAEMRRDPLVELVEWNAVTAASSIQCWQQSGGAMAAGFSGQFDTDAAAAFAFDTLHDSFLQSASPSIQPGGFTSSRQVNSTGSESYTK